MKIEAFLTSLGLERYLESFLKNAVDEDLLPQLTDSDLKEMGINQVGNRRKILDAASHLQTDAKETAATEERAERCFLTVVFIDLVGSTTIAAQLDPEETRDIIQGFHATAARKVQQFEGYVAQFLGDGILAYFGWPVRHEDSAERAIRASLAIIDELARMPPGPAGPIRCRIGIASGMVVVGGHDEFSPTGHAPHAAIGDAPNLAARLQSIARPGSVIIAEATRKLLGDMFIFRTMPPQTLKGFAEPVTAFEVDGERPLESRFAARNLGAMTTVIARDSQMSQLLANWHEACQGTCRAMLLRGEAGIGKSRIAEAFVEATASETRRVIRYQCSPYHGDYALFPAITHINLAAGLRNTDDNADKLSKLEAFLASTTTLKNDALVYLAHLLGLQVDQNVPAADETPQQRRHRILQTVADIHDGMSGAVPLLWIAEDLHWSDPSTLELLTLAASRPGPRKLLLLATTRPQLAEGTLAADLFRTLDVERLDLAATRRMLAHIDRGGNIPEDLKEEIYRKTDGVPLFVEEVAKSIIDRQENPAAASGRARATEISIPATLQDTLLARLGRSAAHKELAQTAAVIGRQFDYQLLSSLVGERLEHMPKLLEDLERLELLFREGTPPDSTYAFKHALVRDAAYGSLLKEQRVKLHKKLLALLEQRGGISPSVKAQHAEAAGLTEKAIDHWDQSATKALSRPAYREAVVALQHCVRLCGAPPDDAARRRSYRFHLLIAQALLASEGYSAQSTIAAFESALAIADETHDPELQLSALFGIWAGHHVAARPASNIAERILSIAQDKKLEGPSLVGLRIVGLERFYEGRFAGCYELVKASYDGYDTSRHRHLVEMFSQDPRAAAGNYLAWVLWFLGRPADADAIIEENLRWMREINHAHTTSLVLCYTGAAANILMRRPDRVRAASTEGVALAEGASHSLWHAWGLVHLGWAMYQEADARGLELMERGLAASQAAGARRLAPFHLSLAAEAFSAAGHHREAEQYVGRAMEMIQATGNLAFSSEILRTRALTRAAAGIEGPEIEADLRSAMTTAQDQGALALELRAAKSLFALLASRNDRQAETIAQELARIVASFGTGSSADVDEAREMLRQRSG